MLKKGSSVNGYKILAQIGQGGMSRVWKVSQEKSGRVLALKEGRTDCMSGKETMERCFRGEEKILRRMNNVAIPALADSFRNEDVPVLVMDFIEGVPLDRKVKKSGPLAEEETIGIAIQICGILSYLHRRQKIIYRDLKPSNIILGEDGKVYLVDFGSAAATGKVPPQGSGDECVGTPGYAAPELSTPGSSFDARADIYSLGATLLFLLTGHKDGKTDDIADRKLADFIGKCLSGDPDQRPRSVKEAARELKSLSENIGEENSIGEDSGDDSVSEGNSDTAEASDGDRRDNEGEKRLSDSNGTRENDRWKSVRHLLILVAAVIAAAGVYTWLVPAGAFPIPALSSLSPDLGVAAEKIIVDSADNGDDVSEESVVASSGDSSREGGNRNGSEIPCAQLIFTDDPEPDSIEEGIAYFHEPRKAVLSVTTGADDFDASKADEALSIRAFDDQDEKADDAWSAGEWTMREDGVHELELEFNADALYIIGFSYTDADGQSNEGIDTGDPGTPLIFQIDTADTEEQETEDSSEETVTDGYDDTENTDTEGKQNFVMDSETASMNRNYVKSACDVSVTVTAAAPVRSCEVTMYRNREKKVLKESKDYTVSITDSGKKAAFTVDSGCFSEDGVYRLIFQVKDQSGITYSNDDDVNDTLNFGVDATAPEINLDRGEAGKLNIEAGDNLKLTSVKLYSGDKDSLVQSWVGADIDDHISDDEIFTADPEIALKEKIIAVATDEAGNKKEATVDPGESTGVAAAVCVGAAATAVLVLVLIIRKRKASKAVSTRK